MINLGLLTFLSSSLADRMKEAGLNTIIGMAVVFVVLIIIAFIIFLFKYIPDGSDKKPKQDVQVTQATKPVKSEPKTKPSQKAIKGTANQDLTNDTELVAVITAAIMASMSEEGIEIPADGLVIRSIRRKTTYSQG